MKYALSLALFGYVAWLFLPLIAEGVAGAILAGLILLLFAPRKPV